MMIRIDFEDKPMVFTHPIEILICKDIATIADNLAKIETFIQQGYYAVGYLAYESASAFNSFNTTKNVPDNQLPLLLFGIFDQFSVPQDNAAIEQSNQIINPSLDLVSNTSRAEYNENIAHIKQQIKRGNTYQSNYTIQFNGQFYADPLAYYQFLHQNQRANYCAYIQYDDLNILSISPELFFKLEGDTITTKPMKGTAARGVNLADDQLQLAELFSEKNQAENMMIVDLLRNDLSRISQPATVTVTQLFAAEKYPTVWQLTSTIQSQLKKNTSLYQIFQALFPCGSITGAPKVSTMQIIADLEKAPRGVYCGTIGYIAPYFSNAVFNIPIRTLTINHHQASYGVGGGITWDSTDNGEYNEVLAKTAILHANSALPEYLIESLLLENGRYWLLDEHLQRLQDSATYFDLQYNEADIKAKLLELADTYPLHLYKVRLCLKENGELQLDVNEISQPLAISELELAPTSVHSNNVYLYHKTSNRSHFPVLSAGQEYVSYNQKGEITEFVNGNIVLLIDQHWVTPYITSGLLAGTMRQFYLKQHQITEQIVLLEDIQRAEKIAFINSVRKWITIDCAVLERLKQRIASR